MKAGKNILFLFADQHRGDWLPYDDETFKKLRMSSVPVRMDHLRALINSGTTFINHMSNSPLCVPARACLASGMQYDRCEVYTNDFCYPLGKKTFYSVLKDGGYQVCGVGKFDLHKPIFYWGKNGWIDQLEKLGFTDAIDSEGKYDLLWSSFYTPKGPYANFLTENGLLKEHARDYILRYLDADDVRPTPLPEFAYADNWVTQNAITKLKDMVQRQSPWFLMVNFSGPHNPWDVTKRMKERWENTQFPIPESYHGDKDKLNAVRQNYAAMLENIDDNIGKILEELKRSGQYEDTVIIYAADHGEMLGDHDRYMKSVPYRGSVHIPLIINGPGVLQGVVRDEMVQLHDLAATITDFAGLSMPENTDSISLKPLACRKEAGAIRDHQVIMLYNSLKYGKEYEDYKEYQDCRKLKPDDEYIQEFCRVLDMEETQASMTKYKYNSDWRCIVAEKFKLIEFENGPTELYNIEEDPEEICNIAEYNEKLINDLKNRYIFREILQ